MAPKRRRPQPQVDEEQQEEEQTPCNKQLKLADQQEQEEEEDRDDSKDNSQIKESNKSAAKTDEEKAVVVEEGEDEVGFEKKPLINRLWSFNDEIIVLKSVIDFKQEFNKDPATNSDAFFSFVKGKLHYTNFTKLQVMDKLRKLRNKYKNILKKSSSAAGGGKDPRFSNPHDLKSYQLSNRIWAHLDANNDINNNAKAACALVEEDIIRVDDENKGMVEKDFGRLYPHLIKGIEGESLPHITLLDGFKAYLSNVDSKLLEEWDKKWKKVRLAETHAYLSRLTLIQEQTNWYYNQMKSS